MHCNLMYVVRRPRVIYSRSALVHLVGMLLFRRLLQSSFQLGSHLMPVFYQPDVDAEKAQAVQCSATTLAEITS